MPYRNSAFKNSTDRAKNWGRKKNTHQMNDNFLIFIAIFLIIGII